jgi:hypothetical protein
MRTLVPYLYAFGLQPEPVPAWAVHVLSWPALWAAIAPTLAAEAAGQGATREIGEAQT